MLIGIGLLLHITDELVGINLGRGFVSSPAWFKSLRPAAHAVFADSETMGRLFKAQTRPGFDLQDFPTKIYCEALGLIPRRLRRIKNVGDG